MFLFLIDTACLLIFSLALGRSWYMCERQDCFKSFFLKRFKNPDARKAILCNASVKLLKRGETPVTERVF
jgi:hypothetical protein